jgi:hypothetical protein
MNIIEELCGYGYVTECLELKNCNVLEQGGVQHSLNLKVQVFWDVTISFTGNNLPVLQRIPSFSGSITADHLTLNDIIKLETSAL